MVEEHEPIQGYRDHKLFWFTRAYATHHEVWSVVEVSGEPLFDTSVYLQDREGKWLYRTHSFFHTEQEVERDWKDTKMLWNDYEIRRFDL